MCRLSKGEGGAVNTADWALVISLGSVLLSLAGFIWNVWSKFIYPKPRVSCGFLIMLGGNAGEAIAITVVNHGPMEITIKNAQLERRALWNTDQFGLLFPLHNFPYVRGMTQGPFSGGLPKKLAVGDEFSLYFPPNHLDFADEKWTDVVLVDTFDRHHRAPRRNMAAVRTNAREWIKRLGPA
jgi:hypothetical protein